MYIQNANPLVLTSPLSTGTEANDYDYYDFGCAHSSYYKDAAEYSKMQRRDSGIGMMDPALSPNIFHDFITEQQEQQDNQSEEELSDQTGSPNSLEPHYFDVITMTSPSSSSCDEFDPYPQSYDLRMYSSYFGNINEPGSPHVEVCDPAAISPSSVPFGDQFSYDYQFAVHTGSISPISPSTFSGDTESDCTSLSAASTPEPERIPLSPSSSVSTLPDPQGKPQRSRGRRVSNRADVSGGKLFTCKAPNCGKVFKRSEHLKRHHRSIHTSDKPFPCPIQTCSKRFSRSDNLNQHIRIHRHGKDSKSSGRHFSNFTPFYTK